MFSKFKIAFVLLLIGAFSGLAIWGTYTLTYDQIQENRARARLEMYLDMFPDMDTTLEDPDDISGPILGMRLVEEPEHSSVFEVYEVYDSNSNQLGYVMRGRGNNDFGYAEVIVGVDMNGVIIDVLISDTDNTPSYVTPLINNYLVNFAGQTLSDVSFDSNTGATATYGVVRRVVEDSMLLIEGDPILSVYQDAIAEVDRYETSYEFLLGVISEEVRLIDSNNDTVGFAYLGRVDYEGHEYRIGVIVSDDEVLKAFVVVEETVPSGLSEALSAFDSYLDQAIEDITDISASGDLEEALKAILEAGLRRSTESEEVRFARNYFLDAETVEMTQIDEGRLNMMVKVFDDQGDQLGYLIEGRDTNDFGFVEVVVQIDMDGIIIDVVISDHDNTEGYVIPLINDYMGNFSGQPLNDVEFDTNTGATATYGVVQAVVEEAYTYYENEMGSE